MRALLRRVALRGLLMGGVGLGAAPAVLAADAPGPYPEKPVHIIVGFPAGTTGDVIARVMAVPLARLLGQQVIVDNRPGAGSSIAAETVAHAPPDGYSLLLSTIANTINPSLYSLSFDFARDLAGISLLAESPALLAAHPAAPATVRAIIASEKAGAGRLRYASSGNGTVTHLYGELFNLATGSRLAHVPYKGSSQAVADVVAGRVELLFSPASTVVPLVKAGKLNAVAAIGRGRIAALPDVPAMSEAGVEGFESGLWFGLNAPRATAAAIVARLNHDVAGALSSAEVREQLKAQSIEPATGTPQDFERFIARDTEKWARVVKAANVHVE